MDGFVKLEQTNRQFYSIEVPAAHDTHSNIIHTHVEHFESRHFEVYSICEGKHKCYMLHQNCL